MTTINEEDQKKEQEEIKEEPKNISREPCEEYLEGWKRAKADLINYKRGEEERMTGIVKFCEESFVQELLPLLQSFDLGVTMAKNEEEKKGIMVIRNQFDEVLRRRGVEKIMVQLGDPFDPIKHEAVLEVLSESPPGTIAGELEAGYLLQGKVIRPTKVSIAKGQE